MVDGVLLNPAIGRTLLAIQRAQSVVDRTSLRLATNKDVNSPFDSPQNFFASRALSNRASDLTRLIDGINRNISVIQEALIGVEALESLLEQGEAIALESQRIQELGQTDTNIYDFEIDATLAPLSSQILGSNPVGYWRLNETAGATAVNLGSGGAAINGTYQGGGSKGNPAIYENNGDVTAGFDGVNDRVAIPDSALINTGNHALRTVELVFNANDVNGGRQVLWEEGGNTNSLNIYIDGGRIYFNTRDAGDFGPFNISTTIQSGETYHAAVVFDFSGTGRFYGYLNGELVGSAAVNRALSSHTGNIGIGALNDSSYMHDGPTPNNTYYFDGQIADVALYNRALGSSEISTHAQSLNITKIYEQRHAQFEKVLTEIDALISDASFRGTSLLNDTDITTYFNEGYSSSLVTKGINFTFEGLGIDRNDFDDPDNLQGIIDDVRFALATVRNYGISLANDLLVLETRSSFSQNLVNNLKEGSDKLTVADMNKESAALLASQTRLDLAVSALGVANLFNASILTVFSG